MIKIPLTDPQLEFVTSKASRPAIVGGLGSGKSRGGTMRLIYQMSLNAPCSGAYYMPTYDLLKLRAMPGIEEDLTSLGLSFTTNKSDYSIKVLGLGTIIFRSYDNPNRIIAYEVAHSICDELDTLSIDKAAEVWRKINERNREKINGVNTIGLVTTPDQGLSGFVYKKWVEQRQDGYVLIKAPTWSNPYLPDDYIDEIRKNYDEKLAEMYISGEFVSLTTNKVYHYFDRERHHTNRELTKDDTIIMVSVDFNIGGCCSTINVLDDNKPVTVGEFVSHDTQDFINHLVNNYSDKTMIIYPDATGKAKSTNATKSDIQMIKAAGYQVDVKEANPRIRDRVNAVNKCLSHDTIKINTNKCKRLVNALESQGYNKQNEPEKFTVHPAIDDWNDSFGYFIAKRFPIHRPTIQDLKVSGF